MCSLKKKIENTSDYNYYIYSPSATNGSRYFNTWDSEISNSKAHALDVGFSCDKNVPNKFILLISFINDGWNEIVGNSHAEVQPQWQFKNENLTN